MKKTMYFNSEAEMNEYFKDGIPSNVLAVVQPDESDKAVLFTTSNNTSASGTMEDLGGYNIDEDDRNKIDYSYDFATVDGASKEYVADYVSTYGGGGSTDLTGYATESYVVSKIEDVVGAAPAALDTLKEIGDSLNNDADFAGTMTAALAGKADASDVYTKSAMDSILDDYATEEFATIPVYDSERGYVRYRQMGKTMQLIGAAEMYQDGVDEDGFPVATYFVLDDMASKSYVADYVSTYGGGEDNVQADWNESDSSVDSYILNKPTIYNVSSGVQYNSTLYHIFNQSNSGNTISLALSPTRKAYLYGVGNFTGANFSSSQDLAYVINDLQDQIDNIPSGGGGIATQEQADWSVTDNSYVTYIMNKPNINAGTGVGSTVEGSQNSAAGANAHVEGVLSVANGEGSHAEGLISHAIADAAHAEGYNTLANGQTSHAEGRNTNAYNDGEHASGRNNISTKTSNDFGNAGNTTFSHGIGEFPASRKNAIEIMENGDLYAYGIGNYDGTNFANAAPLANVINNIQAQIDGYIVRYDILWEDDSLTNIIDCNVDESINGFLDTGTIVARYYQQDINDNGYDAAIGIGMVEYEDEDENIQRVPAVIDTHWEVPESRAKSPVAEPELKQTYKELATKEYVESLIGTALSLSEIIVGEETEPEIAEVKLIPYDDRVGNEHSFSYNDREGNWTLYIDDPGTYLDGYYTLVTYDDNGDEIHTYGVEYVEPIRSAVKYQTVATDDETDLYDWDDDTYVYMSFGYEGALNITFNPTDKTILTQTTID